ncbi:hypothetical protein CEP52_014781 [Fusarium oligoseptatum]|uniref:Zn(2)-C6 fungal-type domain-containing protein n=1 Tax=Fusarium oligoseptatum TaxID=2604345 RepID=A0A428SJ90_9HYPO|nr:hypothetical protein CEP52_014781 [Fusarium oligoseptatum]
MGALDVRVNGCDEQKPSCGRCTRAGIKCTGYGPQFRWSTKYEVFRQDAPKKPKRRETPKRPDQESSNNKSASESNQSLAPSPQLDMQQQNPALDHTNERQDGLCEPLFDNILLDIPGVTDLADFFNETPSSDSLSTAFFPQGLGHSPQDFGQGQELIKDVPDVIDDQSRLYPATTLPPSPSFPISPASPRPQPQSHNAAIEESTQPPQLRTSVVGRLIRKQRKMAFSHRFTSLSHIKQLEKDLAAASELEEYLCSLSHPVETTVLDTEDRNTPVWHLLTLAEAYRSTGLIQLYHIFPDLLDHRLAREALLSSDLNDDHGTDSTPLSCQLRKDWLTSYAVQALNLMKSIPLESGTRDFQPFILVSLSSELRMSPPPVDVHDGGLGACIPDQMVGFTSKTIEVSRMRHFIKSRLNSFLHTLPPKPIHVCLDIVNETWRTMDERARIVSTARNDNDTFESYEDVYWMDVMIQNGWETTMA